MVESTIYFLVQNFTLLQNFGKELLQIQIFFENKSSKFQKKSSMVQVRS
jgi:hypothetical protein